MIVKVFKEVGSTNDELRRMVDRGEVSDEFSAIRADFQTKGRGQVGNGWESQAGKNVLLSVYAKPAGVSVDRQFLISIAVSLAIVDALEPFLPQDFRPKLKIKWPNDIYVADSKMAGILIENRLRGRDVYDSIIGVGLNVNQLFFRTEPPNPVSVKLLTGFDADVEEIASQLDSSISSRLQQLGQIDDDTLRRDYFSHLYRADGGYHDFADRAGRFSARVAGVGPDGRLSLSLPGGETRSYLFKEVEHVIPLIGGGEVTPNL